MEVDLKCLFFDIGNCDNSQMACHYFCKPPMNTTDHSFLLGCKTRMETLILYEGKVDMKPCNIEQYNVCTNHSEIKRSSIFKNCCLCKSFGRVKTSNSGLRPINKLYAIAAWQTIKQAFVFGRQMCTSCRRELSETANSDSFKEYCSNYFEWLYDTNVVHTPSTPSLGSLNVLSQSCNSIVVEEEQRMLKNFLSGNIACIS